MFYSIQSTTFIKKFKGLEIEHSMNFIITRIKRVYC